MARTRWFDPLLSFLRDQPAECETVALTLAEVARLVGGPLPATALARSYWWKGGSGSIGPHLGAIGWQVAQARVRQPPGSIVFERVSPDTIA